MEGLIVRGIGGFYTVVDAEGQSYTLRAQAKLRRAHLTPMVGDRVEFMPGAGEADGWLEAILPRENELIRPPVANLGLLAVVTAAAAPQPDLLLVDRLLLIARARGIAAMVVVNKCDLDRERAMDVVRQYARAREDGPAACMVSARSGEGMDELRRALIGRVHAFGGQSGVGKSTIINALYGLDFITGEVSEKIERGKHTTRKCELRPVAGGGMVCDTPGFSLLNLPLTDPLELAALYPEFAPYIGKCYFQPCAHDAEPGCAVREAVTAGAIHPERYARYRQHYQEMRERWRDRYD